jgi:hypothetical protein
MLPEFSCSRSAAHAKILYGAPETAEFMPFAVRDNYHAVCLCYGAGDLDFVKDTFGLDYSVIFSPQAVGNDEWRSPEAVHKGRNHMIECIAALCTVKCIGIRKERFAAYLLHSANDVMHEDGLHIVRIAKFSYMQFNRNKIAFLNAVESARLIVEAPRFI